MSQETDFNTARSKDVPTLHDYKYIKFVEILSFSSCLFSADSSQAVEVINTSRPAVTQPQIRIYYFLENLCVISESYLAFGELSG